MFLLFRNLQCIDLTKIYIFIYILTFFFSNRNNIHYICVRWTCVRFQTFGNNELMRASDDWMYSGEKKNKGKKWKVNLAILCLGTQWNPSVVVLVTEAHALLWCAFFRLAELVNGIVRADDAWCFQEDETVWRAAMARVLFSRSERALAPKAPQVRPTSHGVWLHNACKTVPLSREWQTTFKK